MSGIVSGASTGVAVVSYSVTNACGAGYATYTVTVMAFPSVSTIYGLSSLCIDSSITLTDSIADGAWSNSGIAVSIGTSTGIVSGLIAGTDTVWYSVSNACGAAHIYKTMRVVNCDSDASVAPKRLSPRLEAL